MLSKSLIQFSVDGWSCVPSLLFTWGQTKAGDPGSITGWGRSPGEGNSNPLQYSCLENSMDRGAWWATVHGVTNSRTRLNDFTSLKTMVELMKIMETFFKGSHACTATSAPSPAAGHHHPMPPPETPGHSRASLTNQMVNTKIRLIIFFVAKDGEALYIQQKQYQELTVAQIMNSLLPNSDLK